MVVSFDHKSSLEELGSAVRAEIIELTAQVMSLLRREYKAQGFNIGLNIGEAAGAGIEEHIHLHVVPRWKGDTNFMSSLGQTRVLPETLEDTYHHLKEAWDRMNS